jgi:Mg-chelatase subunit ChlD
MLWVQGTAANCYQSRLPAQIGAHGRSARFGVGGKYMRGQAGVIIALLAVLGGCSKETAERGTNCIDDDERCGEACNSTLPCAHGLYCATDGRCAKDCEMPASASAKDSCGRNRQCTENGKCIAKPKDDMQGQGMEIPGGRPVDGTGGSGAASDAGNVVVDANSSDCARTTVRTTRVMPTVILIIDQSGSMTDDFGSSNRWDVLRDSLLSEPDGLIAGLQKQVRFGLSMYSARSENMSGPNPVGECPLVTTVEPAFDNFDAIAATYRDAVPIEDTPTGDSIEKIIETLGLDVTDPDVNANPVVFVLATDGEPDRCEELDPQTDAAKQESIDAVKHAFSLGIRTYVISVGDEVGEDHQQDIANAGLGHMAGDPEAEYWTAGDDASLRTALTSIVSSQLSCKIALHGSVQDGTECEGLVTLNGGDLECNGKNGWKLADPKHIELVGDACDDLKASDDVLLDVSFPCTFQVD